MQSHRLHWVIISTMISWHKATRHAWACIDRPYSSVDNSRSVEPGATAELSAHATAVWHTPTPAQSRRVADDERVSCLQHRTEACHSLENPHSSAVDHSIAAIYIIPRCICMHCRQTRCVALDPSGQKETAYRSKLLDVHEQASLL
jgi:hypothetical protein